MNLGQIVSFIRERREQKLPLEVVYLQKEDWFAVADEIEDQKLCHSVDDFGKRVRHEPEAINILGVPVRIMEGPIPE